MLARSLDLTSVPVSWRLPRLSPLIRVGLLAALALLTVVLFLTIDVKGNWDFVLPFRGRKVAAIAIVGFAIAISTVLFQTMTNNRILTPSIMGFDALYMLLQTIVVFFLGSTRLLQLDPRLRFGVEVSAMVLFAGGLYFWLFVVGERSLHLLVLAGIIFGVLFRSVTTFLQRLIAPNDFAILQDAGFASFNAIDQTLLGVSALLVLAVFLVLLRMLPVFDVLALGKDMAIGLGVDYRRTITIMLVAVTILVSVSTALVGPVTFFGLLVANLAYLISGSSKHRYLLPTAGLLAVVALVGGQLILERLFSFNSSLSIMVEFFGGIVFIVLLIRGAMR